MAPRRPSGDASTIRFALSSLLAHAAGRAAPAAIDEGAAKSSGLALTQRNAAGEPFWNACLLMKSSPEGRLSNRRLQEDTSPDKLLKVNAV
jgi:hypothetical protein